VKATDEFKSAPGDGEPTEMENPKLRLRTTT
jgi:hypothetical protein